MAAGAQEPRGDAARLGLRAAVGTPLRVVRRAVRRDGQRGDALGACARVRGRARRDPDPGWLPRAAGDPGRDAAVARARVPRARRPGPRRSASARGGSSGRARTAYPPSSCSTTGRSRSSPRRDRRPKRSWSASTASGRPRSTATARRCSPSSPQPEAALACKARCHLRGSRTAAWRRRLELRRPLRGRRALVVPRRAHARIEGCDS